jgi:hypothetical protein
MKQTWRAGIVSVLPCLVGSSALAGQGTTTPTSRTSVEQGESATPMLVESGNFVGLAHDTSGKANVYQTQDGKRILRLEQFKTSNGPDVRVYLVKGNDATNTDVIKGGGFIDLGALKGNVGDQNYAIPEGTDLSQYRAVSIWCRRFQVNFGAASLERPKTPNSGGGH